jgi:catecholate siderophore receptor
MSSRRSEFPPQPAGTDAPALPSRAGGTPRTVLLPLGAMAAGFGLSMTPLSSAAQTDAPPSAAAASAAAPVNAALPKISVKARVVETDRDSVKATTSTIGKGNQALRDIPQSVTVVTEKLMTDRRLDTLKEVLHNTAGVTFQAAEGGEEDIRLRGFSLAATGDIFVDGMRDPAFYDRDTFANERIELLRGSASMLFGRGSTGGVVNQVGKQAQLLDETVVVGTVGSGGFLRATGDFNVRTGESAALRINAMSTGADNYGNRIRKEGIAPTYRWGIDSADEFSVGLYYLRTDNGINYGIPWLQGGLVPIDPRNYYAPASDYNASSAGYLTLSHLHRFGGGGELKTIVREGHYTRDQRASAIRFYTNGDPAAGPIVAAPTLKTLSGATPLNRGNNFKVQDLQTTYLQSDYANRFAWFGLRNDVLAGVDLAHERFQNYNMLLPAGVTLDKNDPRPTLGNPNDGTSVDESLRYRSLAREFDAKALGVYFQDMVQVAPAWKLLGGLRWDYFRGSYHSPATATVADTVRARKDSLWSKRFGVLYQPSGLVSYHFSYGTSFNTSGDTYQYDDQTGNTPPEASENMEIGAKFDSPDQRLTGRVAIFRATKYNERNRDPDSAATQNLLSGKRHAAGFELDLSGRITPAWEVFGSYAWTPVAIIDVGAPGSVPGVGEGAGTRSALTPRHSGTIWTTYQLTPKFRFGGGLNARSSQTPNRNPVGTLAPRFVTADLLAEYRLQDVALRLNMINVANRLYADSLYTGHYIPGQARQVQLSVGLKF